MMRKWSISGLSQLLLRKTVMNFSALKKEEDCLDVFLWRYIGAKSQFSKLRNMFLMLLILSHGQAQVEHGFSTNKLLLGVNVQNKTLVAQ